MPTPPPWCKLVQLAPLAVLTAKLRIAQSLTASVPSSIASVSRFGLATEPQSRWSRPITIGAFSLQAKRCTARASQCQVLHATHRAHA